MLIESTQSLVTAHLLEEVGEADYGVFVCRVNPMHLGHQAIIEALIQTFSSRHLIFVGSCNKAISIRHMFSYSDRVDFIRAVFPDARTVPLPDFEDDDVAWFRALDDILIASGADLTKTIYIGGSKEDVDFYYKNNRKVCIVNRFGGLTKNVSASEIRDALIEKRPVGELLDSRVEKLVKERFPARYAALRAK